MNLGNLMISNDIFPTKDDAPISLASSNDLTEYLKTDNFGLVLSAESNAKPLNELLNTDIKLDVSDTKKI